MSEGPAQTATKRVRSCELRAAIGYFAANQRVLEYGAGSGYVSSLIAQLGCEVEAIDVASRPWMYWPVRLYDGTRLPYADASFDVVFSCCVLEHLRDLQGCLREMARVLRPGGTMVHIVPTPWWRMWSNVTHYLWVMRILWRWIRRAEPERPNLRRLFIAERHGEHARNAIDEIRHYRLSRWRWIFADASLEIVAERPTGVFHAAHVNLPNLSDEARLRLGRLLGSSSHVFVLRPP